MNKTLTAMIGVLALTVTGCSTENSSFTTGVIEINPSKSDGSYIFTETITDKGITATETATAAKFTFRSNPGSMAGRILGFKVTSAKIGGGQNLVDSKEPLNGGLNIYVQSGWLCTPKPEKNNSCTGVDKNPGSGIESDEFILGIPGDLSQIVKSNKTDATEFINLTFYGEDSTGRPFEIAVAQVKFVGRYNKVVQ
jgi:hypothetical protein